MNTETIALPSPNAGSSSFLKVFRFGPEQGDKVYIQAGLHADEHPGLLTAQRLITKLQSLEKQGALTGHIVVVPFANPVGLRQRVFGHVTGRYDLHTGQNFNRGMALDSRALIDQFSPLASEDASENDRQLRALLRQQVDSKSSDYEIEALHKVLLSLSIDAHYVLDLHCDDHALGHIFYGAHQHDIGVQLAQCMNFTVALEEDVRGTVAFDGTHTQPWVITGEALPDTPFERPCFAATIELRGQQDVSAALAEQDANGILAFLAERKLITLPSDTFTVLAHANRVECYPVHQVRLMASPSAGIVTYTACLGDWVTKGAAIGSLVLLDADTPQDIPLNTPCTGRLMGLSKRFLTAPGQTVAMIAATEPQIAAGLQLDY